MTNRHLEADEWLLVCFFYVALVVTGYLGIKQGEGRIVSRQMESSK